MEVYRSKEGYKKWRPADLKKVIREMEACRSKEGNKKWRPADLKKVIREMEACTDLKKVIRNGDL